MENILEILLNYTAFARTGASIAPTRPEVAQKPTAAALVLVGKSSTT